MISFNSLDASLAYYIKGKIGYGHIYKVKSKRAIIYVLSNFEGLLFTIKLINGKLRSEDKYNQVYNRVLPYLNNPNTKRSFIINESLDLDNYWLSGFSDADASFQIKIISRLKRPLNQEIRLNFQIDQKKKEILNLIKNNLGGNIGYRKSQDTYYYGSTNFGSAKKVINYFDKYHLQSSKYVNYIKWRKAYCLIQNRDHITKLGLDKILKLKNTMNSKLKDI